MKAPWKYAIAASALISIAALITVLDISNASVQKEKTCSGIEVEFPGSNGINFISKTDVKNYIARDYGTVSGKRLEEVNLTAIEEILDGKSSVLKSEAYTTCDGILHILILQRRPAVRFISQSGSWYADSEGYIFPTQKNCTCHVPIVDGNIPVNLTPGHKGKADTAKERTWIEGVLSLVDFLDGSRRWEDAIVQIHVANDGRLVLVPRVGKELFIFGRPEDFARKFAKIEDYYKFIVPEKGKDFYKSVNVSVDGQIVCREKD